MLDAKPDRQKIWRSVEFLHLTAAKHRGALLLGRESKPAQYPGLELKTKSLSAAVVVPIILGDELAGVVNVSSRSPDVEYNEEDLRALEVYAENAGTCIRHMEQSEWMRQTIQNLRRKNEAVKPVVA